MKPSDAPSGARAEEYERLRELALDGREEGGWGMHLLLARGMGAWVKARVASAEKRPAREALLPADPFPADSSRSGLVAVLANMVMGALGEGLPCRS